jgi:hypothetical protein
MMTTMNPTIRPMAIMGGPFLGANYKMSALATQALRRKAAHPAAAQ